MYKYVFSLLLIAFTSNSFAQVAKGIYFELGGPAIASVNYDTRFTQKPGSSFHFMPAFRSAINLDNAAKQTN